MKNLDFKYAFARNFICFGKDGIELDFTKYGNVILIRGYNLDRQDVDEKTSINEKKIASNGSGKSSIPEILVYTLFGRTIKTPKKINHGDVINNKAKRKNLYTEVRWGNYRVVRTRKPDSLRMWESKEGDWSGLGDENWEKEREISRAGIPATQKLIEERLGFNYETFTNIAVFTDNNAGAFLELDAASKRQIVENLLSLDKFREYFDTAKKEKNVIKNDIKMQTEAYQYLTKALEEAQANVLCLQDKLSKWKSDKQNELKRLELLFEIKKKELITSDTGVAIAAYREAQERIESLNKETLNLIENDSKIKEILDKIRTELQTRKQEEDDASIELRQYNQKISIIKTKEEQNRKLIQSLEELQEGTICPVCRGQIHRDNFALVIKNAQEEMTECVKQLEIVDNEASECNKRYIAAKDRIVYLRGLGLAKGEAKQLAISRRMAEIRQEIIRLAKIPKPDSSSREKLIEQQLEKLKEEIQTKNNEINGPSPFYDLIIIAEKDVNNKQKDCNDKKKEIKKLEEELPYYEFFVNAFSEEGIRKFVIAGILPALNSRIAYWLHFLLDSKIKLNFDQELDEIIERNPADGDPFVYHAMSGGERRMLNLAVSQAFAYIMMLNCGASISCAFLDEVTTNIDQIGVQGVYNMIMELSREKQVFVTTHDHDLLDMLSGCDTIELQKKGGFTTLIS